MAVTVSLYAGALPTLLSGLDWATATVRLALVGTGYVFDAAGQSWADVSSQEITGTGYAAGGAALSGKAVAGDGEGGATLEADAATWPTLTATGLRHAVAYVSGTVGGVENPLLCCITFPACDVTAEDFPITWPAGALVAFAPAA